MPKTRDCAACGYDFPFPSERCPHCGRPGLYLNVDAADDDAEAAALRRRYQSARQHAQARGAATAVELFEAEVSNSRAVLARSAGELQRLGTSDREVYATYYQLLKAGVKLLKGERWDALRGAADRALFTGYEDHIRFALLSLDGAGSSGYGECFIVLRTEMIAHRASVFEENSVLFMKHQGVRMEDAHRLPKGYRATWGERPKLCVAKLAAKIDASTPPGAYSALLLRPGSSPEEDDFVEVHIWGPMTIRTMERVTFNPRKRTPRAVIKSHQQRLAKFGVAVG
jgi:hypothetical protein